jgi:hypothetical protein
LLLLLLLCCSSAGVTGMRCIEVPLSGMTYFALPRGWGREKPGHGEEENGMGERAGMSARVTLSRYTVTIRRECEGRLTLTKRAFRVLLLVCDRVRALYFN